MIEVLILGIGIAIGWMLTSTWYENQLAEWLKQRNREMAYLEFKARNNG